MKTFRVHYSNRALGSLGVNQSQTPMIVEAVTRGEAMNLFYDRIKPLYETREHFHINYVTEDEPQ